MGEKLHYTENMGVFLQLVISKTETCKHIVKALLPHPGKLHNVIEKDDYVTYNRYNYHPYHHVIDPHIVFKPALALCPANISSSENW